jgi:hypothetical protein
MSDLWDGAGAGCQYTREVQQGFESHLAELLKALQRPKGWEASLSHKGFWNHIKVFAMITPGLGKHHFYRVVCEFACLLQAYSRLRDSDAKASASLKSAIEKLAHQLVPSKENVPLTGEFQYPNPTGDDQVDDQSCQGKVSAWLASCR